MIQLTKYTEDPEEFDAPEFFARMRQADIDEIGAGMQLPLPLSEASKENVFDHFLTDVCTEEFLLSSETYVIHEEDGTVLALGGLAFGTNPWLLGTKRIDEIPLCFGVFALRKLKDLTDGWAKGTMTGNSVWAGNKRHIAWLELMGYTFQPDTFKVGKEDFRIFYKGIA